MNESKLREMEESGRTPTNSDGHYPSLLCDPSKADNEDEPAVAYYTVCNEYLSHSSRKSSTRAKVSDGGCMPQQKTTSSKEIMCPKHSDKPLEYYCKNDDQFSCSVCANIDHNQCMVQYIEEIATDFHKSNEYTALEKITAELIPLLQKTKDTATRNLNDIATFHEKFISDLRHFRADINDILDSLEDAAMVEAQSARDSDEKTIGSVVTECESMLSDIQRKTSDLEELIRHKEERQLVICSKSAMKTANTYGKRVNVLSNQNRIRDYKFQPNEDIRRSLHSIESIGELKERKDGEQPQHATCSNKGADSCAIISNQPVATYIGRIDVQHYTDTIKCGDAIGLTGGVMIDETKLGLVDYDNYSVKIADLNINTIISCIKLPTRPWDITCVNQDQLVVTCTGRKTGELVFLNVGPYMSKMETVDIGKHCRGIVYTNESFFVTFIKPESSVKAIDMKGNVLKTFKANKDDSALFFNPDYICINNDQKTVFVSDWSIHTVTSLSHDGTIHHVYTADSLKRPRGLAVDRNDNVYIAGYYSHNIHQFPTDGNQSQVILDKTDGMKNPCVVTYCKTLHRLYISVHKGNYDEVSVYQLR